ncbi:MAG: hypothetical protein M1832_003917 [Thelocarpon impressellum]|nr:MAG: hypothetical protein M1832_003917 [Thelocarpon impressellum]
MRRDVLPPAVLCSWARLNGVRYDGIDINHLGEERGFAAIADRDLSPADEVQTLVTVPAGLILSAETVEGWSKVDAHLRQLLESVGELAEKTARGAILVFLLLQVTVGSPACPERVGVQGPMTEYVKFLEPVSLPTTWTEREQALLVGTSLEAALSAKLSRMKREFEHIRDSTRTIPWCARVWWDGDRLTIDDWLLVDAWYRSRALSFGLDADALVPWIDMLNHSKGEATNAYFDRDAEGNAVLLLPRARGFRKGEELTISYGDGKSASEMLFSYGFIDDDGQGTAGLSLDLDIPDDDPLKEAKEAVSSTAGALRISAGGDTGTATWESGSVWLGCVNEEDGLQFRVLQTVTGQHELRLFWKGQDVSGKVDSFEAMLRGDAAWDVYRLRALAMVRARVEAQMRRLYGSEGAAREAGKHEGVRRPVWEAATKLRHMEQGLLKRALDDMAAEQARLMASDVVLRYLGAQGGSAEAAEKEAGAEDDFG